MDDTWLPRSMYYTAFTDHLGTLHPRKKYRIHTTARWAIKRLSHYNGTIIDSLERSPANDRIRISANENRVEELTPENVQILALKDNLDLIHHVGTNPDAHYAGLLLELNYCPDFQNLLTKFCRGRRDEDLFQSAILVICELVKRKGVGYAQEVHRARQNGGAKNDWFGWVKLVLKSFCEQEQRRSYGKRVRNYQTKVDEFRRLVAIVPEVLEVGLETALCNRLDRAAESSFTDADKTVIEKYFSKHKPQHVLHHLWRAQEKVAQYWPNIDDTKARAIMATMRASDHYMANANVADRDRQNGLKTLFTKLLNEELRKHCDGDWERPRHEFDRNCFQMVETGPRTVAITVATDPEQLTSFADNHSRAGRILDDCGVAIFKVSRLTDFEHIAMAPRMVWEALVDQEGVDALNTGQLPDAFNAVLKTDNLAVCVEQSGGQNEWRITVGDNTNRQYFIAKSTADQGIQHLVGIYKTSWDRPELENDLKDLTDYRTALVKISLTRSLLIQSLGNAHLPESDRVEVWSILTRMGPETETTRDKRLEILERAIRSNLRDVHRQAPDESPPPGVHGRELDDYAIKPLSRMQKAVIRRMIGYQVSDTDLPPENKRWKGYALKAIGRLCKMERDTLYE